MIGTQSSILNQYPLKSILTDPQLFGQLSFKQILKLIATDEELTLALLLSDEFLDNVDGLGLSLLGEKSSKVAAHILSTPGLLSKLQPIDLVHLGSRHEIIAAQLINLPIFRHLIIQNRIRGEHVAQIFQNFPDLASKILQNDFFVRNMDGSHVAMLGQGDVGIAWHIVQTLSLFKKLDIDDLSILGQAHESIALMMLNNPKIRRNLEGENYARLGRYHPNVAQSIIAERDVRAMGKNVGIARLGMRNPETAKCVLNDEFWRRHLDGVALSIMGESDGQIAEIIYNDHDLRTRMDIHQKVALGKRSLVVASNLMADSDCLAQMTGMDLKILGSQHPSIAKTILQDKTLFSKLGPNEIGYLGLKDLYLARLIILKHWKELSVHNLGILCAQFMEINQIVLNNAAIWTHLSPEYRAILNMRITTVNAAHHLVCESYGQPLGVGHLSSYSVPTMIHSYPRSEPISIPERQPANPYAVDPLSLDVAKLGPRWHSL